MAIDSRRKRASIASLGLAFLGASIVPDGSLAVGDRQTVANSYYGIDSTVAGIDVGGGTAQLENYGSSGAITLEINLGGDGQLGVYGSTGTVTLEVNVGGDGQLESYSSSGQVQVGEAPEIWSDVPTNASIWTHQNPTETTWDNNTTFWDLNGNTYVTNWDSDDDTWSDETGNPTTWTDS